MRFLRIRSYAPADWSAPMLFASNKVTFSQVEARMKHVKGHLTLCLTIIYYHSRGGDLGTTADHKRSSAMPSQGSLFTNFEDVQVRL